MTELGEMLLCERVSTLTYEMTRVGAALIDTVGPEHVPTLVFRFGDAFYAEIRIMLNQWDFVVRGPCTTGANRCIEGHARGDALETACSMERFWQGHE